VRELEFENEKGLNIHITSDNKFNFSALHCTQEELFKSYHTNEIQFEKLVHLNLDYFHRGLGTLSCGPDTLEGYKLMDKELEFKFFLSFK